MTEVLPATSEGIARAAELVRSGELVAFPTDTVYGLGGAWEQDGVLGRIFMLKQRPTEKRVPILVESLDQAVLAGWSADARVEALAARFWPGPLTIVLAPGSSPPVATESQAFRAPDHPVALDLLRAAGPLYATSANVSGEPDTLEAVDVLVAFAMEADALSAVVDGGRVPGGIPSTVVDLSSTPARVVREGPVTRAQLAEMIDVVQDEEGAG